MNEINKNYSSRLLSIDIIRGFTILVMIFVNDIAGVVGTPLWMKHHNPQTSGMTFVDLVFPAFLFIVGMSIPSSLGRRLEKEETYLSVSKHLLARVFGLIFIGVLMVNCDVISNDMIINPHIWIIAMYLCVIIIWNKTSSINSILSGKAIKYSAIAILVALLFLYKGVGQTAVIQITPSWWGILGLIGFAYLSASLFYLPFRNNQLAILGSMILLYCFYMSAESGLLSNIPFLTNVIHSSYAFGSHAAIVLSGVLLGNKVKQNHISGSSKDILKWAFAFALFQFITGLLLNQLAHINKMFIISKILATVPWCLISSAITIWIWMFIYWLVDVKKITRYTSIVKLAGTNALFAYILAPVVAECFILLSYLFNGFNFYIWLGQSFYIGFLRAVILAFSITWLTGYLSNKGIQLKL